MQLPGYDISEIIDEDEAKLIGRAYSEQQACSVILKIVKDVSRHPFSASKLMNEYELAGRLPAEGTVKVHALERVGASLVLVMEDTGGVSLSKMMGGQSVALPKFLEIAVQLADHLRVLHEHHILHLDIKPDNMIIDPATLKVKLADFGNAALLLGEASKSATRGELRLEGSLPYISPEQTGRMNRSVDNRSDLYSLGIVFYEMLAGQLPYDAEEPTAWIHAHMALEAVSLADRNPVIPYPISAIVAKLMSKNAHDRYQTAYGLLADLKRCRTDGSEHGHISAFPLGLHDRPHGLHLSEKLYGRHRELELAASGLRWMKLGSTQLMLISGQAGVGKTALVRQIRERFMRDKAYFISGKYEQFNHDTPYEPIVRAFGDLVRQLLAEGRERIEEWATKLKNALGTNAPIVSGIIPELASLTGAEPIRPHSLPPSELQHRFPLAFRSLVQAFAGQDRPLVLFLDDLQWADPASLKLIHALLGEPEPLPLLFIGAYRDHEVDDVHPLSLSIHHMESLGVEIREIRLAPLLLPDLNAMLADSLDVERAATFELSRELYRKSAGNPFFFKQLLIRAYADGALGFHAETGSWEWDLAGVERIPVVGGLLEYMMERLVMQPESIRHTLSVAACFGGRFSMEGLADVMRKANHEIAVHLQYAVAEGLVLPVGENNTDYVFLHDRIEQAAYALHDDEARRGNHGRVGRFLQRTAGEDDQGKKVFDIAYHLNIDSDRIADIEGIVQLIMLNLTAGRMAKRAAAYEAALSFLRKGASLFREELWFDGRSWSFDLYLELAECEYLCGHYERAEQLFQLLDERSGNRMERAQVSLIRMRQYSTQGRYVEVIAAGLERLREFRVRVPKKPRFPLIAGEVLAIRWRLRRSVLDRLADLPDMADNEARMVMDLLLTTMAPAFFKNIGLCVLLVCKAVKLSLQYGNHPVSSVAYACFGVAAAFLMKDGKTGYRLGRIAADLAIRSDRGAVISKTGVMFGGMLIPWTGQAKEGDEHLEQALQRGLEAGDYIFASYAMISHINSLYSRETLKGLSRHIVRYMEILDKTRDHYVRQNLLLYHRFVLAMKGGTERPDLLSGAGFDEAEFVERMKEGDASATQLFQYFTLKTQLAYLAEAYESALKYAEAAKAYAFQSQELPHQAECRLYEALAIASSMEAPMAENKWRLFRRLKAHARQMRRWSRNSPDNFTHRAHLLDAELARLRGRRDEAAEKYDLAIRAARQSGFIQHEALACERAALHYAGLGRDNVADVYARDAYRAYARWGAAVKTAGLIRNFPQLRKGQSVAGEAAPRRANQPPIPRADGEGTTDMGIAANSTGSTHRGMDLAVMMKVAQTVSGELDLEQCVRKLMRLIIECAGAQRGGLFLKGDGGKGLDAAVWWEENLSDGVNTQQTEGSDDIGEFSKGIIEYVARTQEIVILDDAAADERFAHDPYVSGRGIKSALAIPVIVHGRLEGVLYLENNLATGAFGGEQRELLGVLASQIIYVRKLVESIDRDPDADLQIIAQKPEETDGVQESLTEREIEVLSQMAAGLSNKEIASSLVIAEGTVKVHIKNIFAKLKVNRRIKAVAQAKELNLLKEG
ncbi:MAG: putative sensor protein [Paenibacillaceae bacterium]|nr:putative sensor protein [Paenibacillaceae bacterium]